MMEFNVIAKTIYKSFRIFWFLNIDAASIIIWLTYSRKLSLECIVKKKIMENWICFLRSVEYSSLLNKSL